MVRGATTSPTQAELNQKLLEASARPKFGADDLTDPAESEAIETSSNGGGSAQCAESSQESRFNVVGPDQSKLVCSPRALVPPLTAPMVGPKAGGAVGAAAPMRRKRCREPVPSASASPNQKRRAKERAKERASLPRPFQLPPIPNGRQQPFGVPAPRTCTKRLADDLEGLGLRLEASSQRAGKLFTQQGNRLELLENWKVRTQQQLG